MQVHAEAGFMLALEPVFYRLSSCKQGQSIYVIPWLLTWFGI